MPTAPLQNRKGWILAGVALVVVVALVAGGTAALRSRQDGAAGFAQLDAQRRVLDMSVGIYSPVFDGFAGDYNVAFAEDRPADVRAAVKADYVAVLEQERRVNTDRLRGMELLVSDVDEPSVQEAFTAFHGRYGDVVAYYQQYAIDVANVTESVAGPCAALAKLNIGKRSIATDYTRAADTCLAALDTAAPTSGAVTKTLLADVRKLVQERRDEFAGAMGQSEALQAAANLAALLSLVDINAELRDIQTRYGNDVKAGYDTLVSEVNVANSAFEQALEPFVTPAARETEG